MVGGVGGLPLHLTFVMSGPQHQACAPLPLAPITLPWPGHPASGRACLASSPPWKAEPVCSSARQPFPETCGGQAWLRLLIVCCLHRKHYFIFVLFFFQLISWHSQRHRFHNLPGVPRELGSGGQSCYYSAFHRPPSPRPTALTAAATARSSHPARPS